MEIPREWEHKCAKNGIGNGKSTRDSGNGNGYFFMCAKNGNPTEWEHKCAKNGIGNGKSTRDSGNGNGYFFMCAKNSHRSTRCEH